MFTTVAEPDIDSDGSLHEKIFQVRHLPWRAVLSRPGASSGQNWDCLSPPQGSEEHSPFTVEIGDLLRVFLLEPARSCNYPSLLSTIRSASRGTHFFIFSLLRSLSFVHPRLSSLKRSTAYPQGWRVEVKPPVQVRLSPAISSPASWCIWSW